MVELSITVLALVVLIAGAFLLGDRMRAKARTNTCSPQVRSVVRALVTFTNGNQGNYPLPSQLDTGNTTVAEEGNAKNTTANIFSILVFHGFISTEILVSPNESNTGRIEVDSDYQLTNPAGAVRPADALWDPAFNADFTDPNRKGNLSYAHLLPAGARLEQWKDTFSATEAVFGNRGPRFQGTTHPTSGRWVLTNDKFGTGSYTLAIHGGRSTWEGNIGYNDGHVSFETKPNPETVTYQRAVAGESKPVPTSDNLFVDETDDSVGSNVFMSIFKSAGPDARQFEAIWD